MSRLHDINSDVRPTAILVGIPTPDISDEENQSSLDELGRLVHTLGYDVIGRTFQRRKGTGGALVMGEGKIDEIARFMGGMGTKALGAAIPNAINPKLKKAFTRNLKKEGEESDDDGAGDSDSEFGGYEEEDRSDAPSFGETHGLGEKRPDCFIFDLELTPSQLRNLERAFGCDVLDRTGVIIEIFSRHAKTRAARLQVEIAKLTYMAPRIREAGGGSGERQGSSRGAGESSIELDRRKIRDRIKELKTEFESIDNEHDTRRSRRSELRTVALVGYTNAGKSSMMRALTGSEVYVADKLFATLDTTVRPIFPQTRPQILVSDTVGFIKKLPHDLVASFKSTLDEALNASLLLFVVDASDASFRAQLEVTQAVLKEVGAVDIPSLLILNKSDKLSEIQRAERMAEFPDAMLVTTRDPADLERLRTKFISYFEGDMIDAELFVPYVGQSPIGEIRSSMRILSETYEALGIRVVVRATEQSIARLKSRFSL